MNLINKLESKNLDVSKKDSNGNTAFHVAAKSGNITVFEILRNKKKKALSSKNKVNKTPIQLAAIHGYTDIMKMLINNGCELTKDEIVDILRSNKIVDKTQNTEDGNEPSTKDIIPKDVKETSKEPRGDRQSRVIPNFNCKSPKIEGKSNVIQPSYNSTTLVAIPKSILKVLQFIKGCLKDKQQQGSKNTWDVLDVKDSNDNTALHIAAELGLVEVCEELFKDEIETKLDIYKERKNKDEHSALHVAVKVNNLEVLKCLLESKCNVNAKDRKGQCPLIMALILGKDKKGGIVQALMERDDDAQNKIHSFKTARNQKNILHKLVKIGDIERLQVVLNIRGVDVDQLIQEDCKNTGKNVFHYVAEKGSVECYKLLTDKFPGDPKSLLQKGEKETGMTVAHILAKNGHESLLKMIIELNQDIIEDEDKNGNIPLHIAVQYDKTNCIAELLRRDDKLKTIKASNKDRKTPFHFSNLRTFEVLIDQVKKREHYTDAKSLLNEINENGNLLSMAIESKNAKLVSMMIEFGFPIKTYNYNALFEAIRVKNRKVIETIIDHDAKDGLKALKHVVTTNDDHATTPMRELIKYHPNQAMKVLDTIGMIGKDKKWDKENKWDVECLEDSHSFYWDKIQRCYCWKRQTDELLTVPYTYRLSERIQNHPLYLMVKYKRRKLLKHPVVTALCRNKWENSRSKFLIFQIVVYILFVASITNYGLTNLTLKDISNKPTSEDEDCFGDQFETNHHMQVWSILFVVLTTSAGLAIEFSQLLRSGRVYLKNITNCVDVFLYFFALIITSNINLDIEAIHSSCSTVYCWKWPGVSILLTVSWLNLLGYLKWFLYIGNYLGMVIEIFKSIFKAVYMFGLVLWAFTLGMHVLLFQQDAFKTLGWSYLKMLTMATGEFEYGSIFIGEDPVTFPATTVVMYIIVLIFLSIILMNLTIGLSISDIRALKENADLENFRRQLKLVLVNEIGRPFIFKETFKMKVPDTLIDVPSDKKRHYNLLSLEISHLVA